MQKRAWILGIIGGLLVILFMVQRFALGSTDTSWMAVGGVGAVLLGLYLWLDREGIGDTASSRSVRYSTGATLTVILALGVAVAITVLGKRYDERWDVTEGGRYTLSEQSLKIAGALNEPVQVIGFFQSASVEENSFKDLIEGFQAGTDKLELTLVDPVTEPMMAQQFAITSAYGTVVLVQGEKRQRLESSFTEEALTNALVRLESAKDHVVCFTTGHGEREVDDDSSPEGLGGVVIKMEDQNYTAKPYQPLREGPVPADCEVVVVVGPQVEFLPQERDLLASYVAGGGALFVMVDPLQADAFAADLSRYGFQLGNDLVLEDNPTYQLQGGDASYVVMDKDSFDFHPIVSELRAITLLRVARSVDIAELAGVNLQVLARTSESAWAEINLMADGVPSPDPETELIGDVPLIAVAEVEDPSVIPLVTSPEEALTEAPLGEDVPASETPEPSEEPVEAAPEATPDAAATELKPGGRVVVFGDSDFVSNALLVQGENQDLFLNAIAWLVGEEDQISIRTNEAGAGTLTMSAGQGILVWLLSLIFIPGLVLAVAVATWMRRRSL